MAEEWFDVVDEADRVVGGAPRSRVHAQGLRHRAIHALVCNGGGRLFLQRRSESKDCHPGVWDSSCSGHCDRGEDYRDTALREMGEEIGLFVAPGELEEIGALAACEETGQEFVRVYLVRHEGPFRLHPDEISEGRWWSREEVLEACTARPGEFAPAFRHLIARFAARLPWR